MRRIEVTLSLAAIALTCIICAAWVGGDLATAFIGLAGTAVGAIGGIAVQGKIIEAGEK